MVAVQPFLLFIQFWWQYKTLKLLMPQLFYMQSEKGSVWFGHLVLCFFFLWTILDSSLVLCKWLRYLFCKFGILYYIYIGIYTVYIIKDLLNLAYLRFLNQPMFKYNQEYGFSIMNYVMAGLCTFLLLAPIACVIRERQMRNLSTIGCDWTCSKKTNVISPQNEMTSTATE